MINRIAIALSIVFGFLGTEFLGLCSGGMISAGYLALYVQDPLRILCTLACSFAVYGIVRLLDKFTIIYGRRRFMACVLIGYIIVWAWSALVPHLAVAADIRIIGWIVPGLIANDMVKNGIGKTMAGLVLNTLATALLLVVYMVVA